MPTDITLKASSSGEAFDLGRKRVEGSLIRFVAEERRRG